MSNDPVYQKLAHACFEWGMLRQEPHRGWRRAGIERPENVAEHTQRAALLAYVLAKLEGADAQKCVLMTLIHDLGEIRIGDHDKLSARYIDTKAAEQSAFADQLQWLPESWATELRGLFLEYEDRTTTEGVIAKDADWLEQAIAGLEYMDKGYPEAVQWVENVAHALETEAAKNLLAVARKTSPHDWWRSLPKMTYTKLAKND